MENLQKVIQNLRMITIMKSCNYTDKDIATYLGMNIKTFLEIIGSDAYLTELYEKSQERLASEIERQFLDKMLEKLDGGDTTDAKWVLERSNKRYQKKDIVDVTIKSIDDIIREKDGDK
mgnify:CR=1 FL=1